MSALQTLLAGLFDYAGLYPPANLSLQSAANNYLEYSRGEHAPALGRFIIHLDRLEEFHSVVGDSLPNFKLSVIANEAADWALLAAHISAGFPIEAVEVKCGDADVVKRVAEQIPLNLEAYFEVPMNASSEDALAAIRAVGGGAKLPFKATAGLHHPLRSTQPLTYQPQCPTAVMHGFMNLSAASTLIRFGGSIDEAQLLLAEEDSSAWRVGEDYLSCRDRTWTIEQLANLRSQFFMSIGSCSFEEPIRDLESLGWL
jgi:hypothetical protein